MKSTLVLTSIMVLAMNGGLFAKDWGSIKGQFVFDGTAPKAAKIIPTKDLTVCGKHPLFDEELVVNPKNNGIQNVVISLYLRRGKTVDIHPSYQQAANAEVKIDNKGCRFAPHVLPVWITQTLIVGNSDSVPHNTKIDTIRPQNEPINPIIPATKSIKHKFNTAEPLPVTVSCSIHPWMRARLVVKEHPYVAVTDADGKFEIKNLPAGSHTFQVWQEKVGYVKYKGWRRGRVTWKVGKGGDKAEDVGTFKVKL